MHLALRIEEILLNIFGHCYERGWALVPGMASLARTCRAFKDPALDVLWGELSGLDPLARCLPKACYQLPQAKGKEHFAKKYSFRRPLTQAELDILRSYTRRIRSIVDFSWGLDEKALKILSDLPTTDPLFPNLRRLYCHYTTKATNLLHLPFPSLTSLKLHFENLHWFQDALGLFPESSPNIRNLSLEVEQSEVAFNDFVSNWICRWRNLGTMICPQTTLNMDALVHLSCMPALTRLDAVLPPALSLSDTPLFFPNLKESKLHSGSLEPISQLLSQARMPVITDFTAIIDSCPLELSSFLAGVQTSSAGHTIEILKLDQQSPPTINLDSSLLLCLEDLRPCMAFRNLRRIEIDIKCSVQLGDSDVLALASALPQLKRLFINVEWGWNTLGGITPNGLLQLLQTCRLLNEIALAIDTQGYTELPPSGLLESLGLTLPLMFSINVLDSLIEAESVPALAAFFAGIFATCPYFYFHAWDGRNMEQHPGWEVYRDRWHDVYTEPDDPYHAIRLAVGPPSSSSSD